MAITGILVELAAACGNDAAALTGQGPYDVFIVSGKFMPPNITVKLNETVTWSNKDSKVHTIVSDSNIFKQTLQPGGNFSFTFTEHNNFRYHDISRPRMKGMVLVEQDPDANCNDCHG